jgi:flagellar basal body-associated protein FliL
MDIAQAKNLPRSMLRITPIHWCMTLALTAWFAAGCSHPVKTAPEMDASELLALFQERQHVDAKNFVEMDLGRFRVTHKLASGEGQLYVQFHLFGILPQQRQTRLAQLWPQYEKRVRDAIISLTQRTETEHLSDPSLTFFKEEVAATVNRVLQERLLVDVAFSDFSTDREAGVPWSVPASDAKPAGGHGGGHGH